MQRRGSCLHAELRYRAIRKDSESWVGGGRGGTKVSLLPFIVFKLKFKTTFESPTSRRSLNRRKLQFVIVSGKLNEAEVFPHLCVFFCLSLLPRHHQHQLKSPQGLLPNQAFNKYFSPIPARMLMESRLPH